MDNFELDQKAKEMADEETRYRLARNLIVCKAERDELDLRVAEQDREIRELKRRLEAMGEEVASTTPP